MINQNKKDKCPRCNQEYPNKIYKRYQERRYKFKMEHPIHCIWAKLKINTGEIWWGFKNKIKKDKNE